MRNKTTLTFVILLAIFILYHCSRENETENKEAPVVKEHILLEVQHAPYKTMIEGISLPVVIHKVEPEFPEELKNKPRELSPIIVEALITENGEVRQPRIINSNHPDLDKFVLEALKQWKFEPAKKNGKPVPYKLTFVNRIEVR